MLWMFSHVKFTGRYGLRATQDRLLARDYLRNSRVAFLHQERVGVLILRFSKLNSPARRYPCLRFK
jgi:hypothetical protein